MANIKKSQIGLLQIWQYALIVLPTAFASIPIYIFMPDYYTTVFKLSLSLISITLFSLRIIDAIIDPLIGYYSDLMVRYRKVIFPTVLIVFAFGFFILCFPILRNIWLNFIIGVFLATLGYSIITINVNAIGATWSSDSADKLRIISVREVFAILGVLLASVLPVTLNTITDQAHSLLLYACIFIVLLAVFGGIFIRWLNNEYSPVKSTSDKKIAVKVYFKQVDRYLIYYFISYMLTAIGSAIPAVMLLFYSRHVLQTPTLSGLYLFLYFSGVILGVPVWRKLAPVFGLRKTWAISIIVAILIFAWAFFLSEGEYLRFSIICVLSGICFGAELILPNTLLAMWLENSSNKRLANGYYAALALITKFTLAIATVICLPTLDAYGFKANQINTPEVLLVIKLLYTVLPCLFKGLAMLLLLFWQRRYSMQKEL